MQKDVDMNSASDTDLITSLTHIRLVTDTSRLCAITKSWVGYNHSIREMDNTVFPHDQGAWVLELMKATKVPKWTNLKTPLFPVTSRGQLGWSPPTRLDGPYQVARVCLFYKLWTMVLPSRHRYTNDPRNLPMHKTSATMQTKLAERSSNWGLNSYWVVQC